MRRRGTRMIALALTLLLPLGAGGCAPQREGSAGLLYRVTGGKSELYLLGSIHVGSEEMYPMGQHILDALEAADVLAFECDTQSAQAQAAYRELMCCPEGESLESLVSADTYALVVRAAQQAGYQMDSLDALKPWAVMSMLNTGAVTATLGAKGSKASVSLGVEEQVRKLGGNKPQAWLEDTRAELEVLDGLSPALQESLLCSTCRVILEPESATGMDASIDQWPDWWRAGDVEAFASAYLDGMAAEPNQALAREYHAALVTDRNARMACRMAEWLETGETYFVTLGLLHLVLDGDSVLTCLEEMGYTVERILPKEV